MHHYSAAQREAIQKAGLQFNDTSTNGKKTPGLNAACGPTHVPEWFERETFAHAQKLFQVYGMIIAFTQVYGLLLGLNSPEGLLPLLTTGNSKSVFSLFRRYISTIRHIFLWFNSDPFDPNSEAYKSLKTVRGLHYQVYEKLNRASGKVPNEANHLWLSQAAMAGAQFSFFGLMTLFPKQLGYHNFTSKDFHAIFHFWRTIGYCLGMEDRYNLCSGTDAQIGEISKLIYFTNIEPLIIQKSEPTAVEMGKGVCLGFTRLSWVLSYNILMRYHATFLKMKNTPLNPEEYQLNFKETIYYWVFTFILNHLSRYPFITRFLSKMFPLKMRRNIEKMNSTKRFFADKYSDIEFTADNRCPFNIQLNYKANI